MKVHFDSQKKHEPTREKGVRIPYAPAKRKIVQWRWYLILLIVSSPLIYFLTKLLLSFLIVTAPGYVSLEKVSINSTAVGIVERIHVRTGDMVTKNQVLADIYNPNLDERKSVLQAELEALDTSAAPAAMQTASSLIEEINLAKRQAAYQAEHLEKVRFLYDAGAATNAELDLARAQYDKALLNLTQAGGRLVSLRETRERQVRLPESSQNTRRKTIQAELKAIGRQQRRQEQRAIHAGRILEIFAVEGESLAPGNPIFSLGRADKPLATVYLDPKYARYALKGRMATVTLPNGIKIRARVREDAHLTRRLPADISSPIGARDLMILVTLDFLAPLPVAESVDGLPISTRFDSLWNPF